MKEPLDDHDGCENPIASKHLPNALRVWCKEIARTLPQSSLPQRMLNNSGPSRPNNTCCPGRGCPLVVADVENNAGISADAGEDTGGNREPNHNVIEKLMPQL